MGNEKVVDAEFETQPVESSKTEIAQIMSEGDPEILLEILEKKARLANRLKAAIELITISQTYPADWTIQGDGDKAHACLGSAGAERIGRNFPIKYYDIKWAKEEFTDFNGSGYRYLFTGYGSIHDRTVYAEGSYSTRDEFLGKARGEWRPLEEINEGDIRSAAHHIFCGNVVKELLGLRGMPASEYRRIMGQTGQDVTKSASVERSQGVQGGISTDDFPKQKELVSICIEIANAGCIVERNDKNQLILCPMGTNDPQEPMARAEAICIYISGFQGKDGFVSGMGAKQLKGKRLDKTLGIARHLKGILGKEAPIHEPNA